MSQVLCEDGDDIFEITDFTTATEFERFVSRLEEVIHEWKLTQEPQELIQDFDISLAEWSEVSEEICYIDFPFLITHYSIKQPRSSLSSINEDKQSAEESNVTKHKDSWPAILHSMQNNKLDFPGKSHCICRWFGLVDFVVVSPKSYALSNEDRINMILSAIKVATQNSNCLVPIFVQALEEWRKFYLGFYQAPSIETSFEMVHLRHIPDKFQHLSGLLDVYKGKLNIPIENPSKVAVSIRFTFILQDWEEYMFDWPQSAPDMVDESPAIGFTKIDSLPFGACEDPVEDMYLFTTWPSISEDVVTESAVYSDLDPLHAPLWTVRITMANQIQCLLADTLQKFAALCGSSETFDQVLGRMGYNQKDNEETDGISSALERLTDPQVQYNLPSLSKVTKAVSNTKLRLSSQLQENSPIPSDILNKILLYLFPDAKDTESPQTGDTNEVDAQKDMFRFYKTAPVDSPVYKLAICCCIVNYAFGGLKAVAHLWQEFVLELRYRLENSILIPGLEPGSPNLGMGILYQKLQMLNCCIEKRKQREVEDKKIKDTKIYLAKEDDESSVMSSSDKSTDPNSQYKTPTSISSDNDDSKQMVDGENSSDDEFFECETNGNPQTNEKCDIESPSVVSDDQNQKPMDSVDSNPCGRLRQLDDLRLLNVDEALYIPVTQEPAPMTEDLLAEHAEVLTRLGTSTEGASLRAKMQSASLLSDMESFKAANPGCILEDFVRWYSPRDYQTELVVDKDTGDTVEKGTLSERMRVSGNMWQEVWESAKSVPARRQKRLFNDTKEAERVLHFMSNLTPAQLVLHLLPMACQAALVTVKSQGGDLMPKLTVLIDSVNSKLEQKSRHSSQSSALYTDSISQLKLAELVIARARSLHLKFACDSKNKENEEVKKFVLDLMQQEEVKVIGGARGPVGKAIHRMFSEAKSMQDASSVPSESTSYKKDSDEVKFSDSIFPAPVAKEYILRSIDPRPTPYSRVLPHRMYCTLVDGKEYRLAGAFSSDTIFH